MHGRFVVSLVAAAVVLGNGAPIRAQDSNYWAVQYGTNSWT